MNVAVVAEKLGGGVHPRGSDRAVHFLLSVAFPSSFLGTMFSGGGKRFFFFFFIVDHALGTIVKVR